MVFARIKKPTAFSLFLGPMILGMALLASCGKSGDQGSGGSGPKPTHTPFFKLTPVTQMVFPNPWDKIQPLNVRPPIFPAPTDVKIQLIDSSFEEVLGFGIAKLNPGSEFTLPANMPTKHGTPYLPGTYYLVITTSFGTWVDQIQVK